MNCIIVDDTPMAVEVLERYVAKLPAITLLKTFRVPHEAILFINENQVDFILLDINMPGLSGINLVKELVKPPLIIFTTAHSEFAAESYLLNAVDYLLKPVTFSRFLMAIEKVQLRLTNSIGRPPATDEFINLKSGSVTHRVKISDIVYLKKEENYFTVHTGSKKILIRENMNNIFSILPDAYFIQVHKSYVVSILHINIIESTQLTVKGNEIPVGYAYKNNLKKIVK